MITLHQQTPRCADIDVTLAAAETPAFRALLPEFIFADELPRAHRQLLHNIPGTWQRAGDAADGRFTTPDPLDVSVRIHCGASEIAVTLAVRNVMRHTLTGVHADICVAANHLPGEPGWFNPRFIPAMPMDRFAQGRRWFEELTPGKLQAFTGAGWVDMHPCPACPDADAVPLYSFTASAAADAVACAIPALDGAGFLFQAWASPGHYCSPCPGNACMHLLPRLARVLEPGATAILHGLIGIHDGDRRTLEEKIVRFRDANGNK